MSCQPPCAPGRDDCQRQADPNAEPLAGHQGVDQQDEEAEDDGARLYPDEGQDRLKGRTLATLLRRGLRVGLSVCAGDSVQWLHEGPQAAFGVAGAVLAEPVRLIGGRVDDLRALLDGMSVVSVDILDHHRRRTRGSADGFR